MESWIEALHTCSDTDYLSLPSFQLSILVQTRITDHVPLLSIFGQTRLPITSLNSPYLFRHEVIGKPCLHKYGELRKVIGNPCLNKYGEMREVIGNPCLNKYGEITVYLSLPSTLHTCSDMDYQSLPSSLHTCSNTDYLSLPEQVWRVEESDR
jgi:hypothetical protein